VRQVLPYLRRRDLFPDVVVLLSCILKLFWRSSHTYSPTSILTLSHSANHSCAARRDQFYYRSRFTPLCRRNNFGQCKNDEFFSGEERLARSCNWERDVAWSKQSIVIVRGYYGKQTPDVSLFPSFIQNSKNSRGLSASSGWTAQKCFFSRDAFLALLANNLEQTKHTGSCGLAGAGTKAKSRNSVE